MGKIINLVEFFTRVKEIVRDTPIEGLKTDIETAHFGTGASFRWQRGWTISASLDVEARLDTDEVFAGGAPIGKVLTGVSWSASQRDVATAQECLALYTAVVALAAKIEDEFKDTQVAMVHG